MQERSAINNWVICGILCNYHLWIGINSAVGSVDFDVTSWQGRTVVAVICCAILAREFTKASSRRLNLLALLILTFWLYYLVRLSVESYLNPGSLRQTPELYFMHFLGNQVIPAMAIYFLSLRATDDWGAMIWIGLFSLCSLLWVIITQSLGPLTFSRELKLDYANSTGLSVTALWVFIACLFSLVGRNLSVKSLLYLTGALMTAIMLVVFSSRASLLIACLSVCVALVRNGVSPIVLFFVTATAVLIFNFISYASYDSEMMFVIKMNALFSDSNRTELLFSSVDEFVKGPILGRGIEPLGWYPHNLIAESFLLGGATTGIFFTGILSLAVFYSIQLIKTEQSVFVGMLGLSAIIASMVTGNLYNNINFWGVLALLAGTMNLKKRQRVQPWP